MMRPSFILVRMIVNNLEGGLIEQVIVGQVWSNLVTIQTKNQQEPL